MEERRIRRGSERPVKRLSAVDGSVCFSVCIFLYICFVLACKVPSALSDSVRPYGLHAAHQAPLSMGFSREEYWKGLPFPSPGDLPHLGIEPMSLTSLALVGGFFTTSAIWEAPYISYTSFCKTWEQRNVSVVHLKSSGRRKGLQVSLTVSGTGLGLAWDSGCRTAGFGGRLGSREEALKRTGDQERKPGHCSSEDDVSAWGSGSDRVSKLTVQLWGSAGMGSQEMT